MALVLDDRVKETSTTTGTGTLDLSGAVSGFQTFVAGIGDGNTTYYAIVNRDEAEWETGLGTITDSSTDTLARTTVLASSNSDSAVDFSAGTKDVFCTLPASKVASLDTSDNLTIGSGSAGVDYTLTFDGADSDGVITWMEDEDHFKFSDDVVMDSTKKLYFYDKGGEYISSNGSDLSIVAGDDIHLDATGNTWKFLTNTTLHFYIESNSGEMSFVNESQDLDQLFKGNDGGNAITALKLDMSDAGAATFNDKVIATELDISGNMDIDGTSNLDAVDIDGTLAVDGTTISLDASTSLNIDNSNTSNGITIATATSGVPISIGHATSETTVNDNLTVTGTLTGTLATAAQGSVTSLGTLTTLTVDNVNVNGTTIGHTSDTDLLTFADGLLTVAGEVSMTTLDIGGTNVTSTAAELNILDGVTSTAAELNILDGVTATAAELNYSDGVTSNIQTQLDAAATTGKAIAMAIVFG